jgi:putative membrane protein
VNRIKLSATLLAGALSLAACGHKTETTTTETVNTTGDNVADVETPAAPALTPGQTFANTAAASDAFEIETSKLALQLSQSDAVKAFARQMVTAHTTSTEKLKAAAAGVSPAIAPDPTLTPEQQQKLADLKTKTGAAFDTAYAAEQVAGHQATLDALKAYAASPDVAPLSQFATTMVPIVTAHLNMAKSIKP